MSKEKKRQAEVLGLIVALVVVLIGGLLFVGAVSGWFDDNKVVLDSEYYKENNTEFLDLDVDGYEKLINDKKSFIVFVDQGGCKTADNLRNFVSQYMQEFGVVAYRMMFSDVKESSLHDFVKYYPSVVIVDKGKPRWYLKADFDEDAEKYNKYDVFEEWMKLHL